jgi:putative DNA primase/helicase
VVSLKGQSLACGKDKVADALDLVCRENSFHPVRDWLLTSEWDGVERINFMPEDVFGVENSELNYTILRKFLISAVARVMQPGCKVDTALILVGPQGVGKSSFFKVLAGDDFFGDTSLDLSSKDSLMALRGKWIYELAELSALSRARDQEMVKAFLSSAVDAYRPSYGRFTVSFPRQTVFGGTVNNLDFLSDTTGNRRYMILETPFPVEFKLLEESREQIWAEAFAAYERGEHWILPEKLWAASAERAENHTNFDPWVDQIVASTVNMDELTTFQAAGMLGYKELQHLSTAENKRLSSALRSAGFKHTRKGMYRTRVWVRA